MKIAVIGGIGSGKSRVINYLKELGERTCDCDEIYKEIMQRAEYISQVDSVFKVVRDGQIDKKALAQIIFKSNKERQKLNDLAHPLVFQKVDEIYSQEDRNLYVEVSAFDIDMKKYFDEIILVKSAKDKRIERVKVRNNFQENYILSIIDSQLSDEQMESIADFVIINDGDLEELSRQVEHIIAFHNF